MEGVIKSILVPGEGSTSKEVREIANSVASGTSQPRTLTHEEVKELVAENISEVKIVKARGGSSAYPTYIFRKVRLVSASELAQKAELLLVAITLEEWQAASENVKWARDVTSSLIHPEIERATSGFSGARRVLVIKCRRRRMESAHAAAVLALQMAEGCRNVAKISNVGSPFGMGTICLLAPDTEDVVVFDNYEADGEGILKAKAGLPNRMLLDWSYKLSNENPPFRLERMPLVTGRKRIEKFEELPTPVGMYEWEGHGLLEACLVIGRDIDFSVIGLVTDNLGRKHLQNQTQEDAKEGFKAFMKRVFEEDGFFFTSV